MSRTFFSYAPAKHPGNRQTWIKNSAFRFGDFGRYRIRAMHTRFDTVEFFVYDAEQQDDFGLSLCVAQGSDINLVLAKFGDATPGIDRVRAFFTAGQ